MPAVTVIVIGIDQSLSGDTDAAPGSSMAGKSTCIQVKNELSKKIHYNTYKTW